VISGIAGGGDTLISGVSGVAGTVNGVTGFSGGGGATFASRSPTMSFRFATTRHENVPPPSAPFGPPACVAPSAVATTLNPVALR
jgi:hypothetical protein